MELAELLYHASIFSIRHAEYIGMSRHIYKRARYNNKISEPWRQLLELRAGVHPHWRGFKICDGVLITPSGETLRKNQIDNYKWALQLEYERGRESAESIQRKLVWG